MKKFLKHIVILLIAAFGFANLIALGSLSVLRKSSFYKPNFISNLEETNFDYVLLGSSTSLTTLNTFVIDSISGLKGINASMDDTSMGSHYLMLQHFLAEGKKASHCILTINPEDIGDSNPTLSGNDYRFLPEIKTTYVKEYYNNEEGSFFGPLRGTAFIPAYGVSYYNAEIFYPSLVSILKPETRNRFDSRGNYVYPNTGNPATIIQTTTTTLKINNPYFNKIEELCSLRGIELILYQPPIYKRKVVSADLNLNFINHSGLLDHKWYFYDVMHVNKKGRFAASVKFTKELQLLRNTHAEN
jgi:hypothetical protein